MAVDVDLEGRTPLPRWQACICLLIAAMLTVFCVADVLGYAPRPAPVPIESTVNRLERSVNEIKTDQDQLRADQESLRKEMQAGFASLRNLLQEKKKP